MKSHRICSTLVLALAALSAAQAATPTEDHGAHHPGQVAPAPPVDPKQYDQQMKAMQEMHRKMLAAKTPEERAALMKDHMKTMQDGMGMMGRMRQGMAPGGMPKDGAKGGPMQDPMAAGPDMMQRRMDMMEMMMQMMMDRQGGMPPAAK